MSLRTPLSSAAAVTVLTALAVGGFAGVASAHVTANPRTAEQGSFTKVSFRVPNERDDAGTTKLVIEMPSEHPIAHVSVRPVPGWKVEVKTAKPAKPVKTESGELTEAVSTITWSGGEIEPGQFEEFDVSMGPLPTGVGRVVFKAEQTYSGGEVVNWDQPPGNGQEEPEHPAPSLTLTPKNATTAPVGGSGTAGVKASAVQETDPADGTARLVGGLGLAAGVAGIGIGAFGLARGTRERKQS
jgi:uncharacterized protein YcnI